jgi:hypothetical protein
VDPVEGGSANNYDYTNADPTNTTDLDGKAPAGNWGCPYKDKRGYCTPFRPYTGKRGTVWSGIRNIFRAVSSAMRWGYYKLKLNQGSIRCNWTAGLYGAAVGAAWGGIAGMIVGTFVIGGSAIYNC